MLDGYLTEKIILAFAAGCVPIYYGSPYIFDVFDARAFIYYNISNPHPALNLVAHLESNATAYNETLGRPILANGMGTVEEFLSISDTVGNGSLKRKIREMFFYASPA